MVSLSIGAERNEDGRRSGHCGQLLRGVGGGLVSDCALSRRVTDVSAVERGSNPKPICAAQGYDINLQSVAVLDEGSLSRRAKLRSGSTRDATSRRGVA